MKKIIIDTDPGIDDAIALCYAFAHPHLEIVALTSIFGNVSSELAAQNALRLCKLTGASIPVARGADIPLEIPPHPHADFVHGANGFGNIELPLYDEKDQQSANRKVVANSSAELIVEQVRANPAEITIIAVGPLTNLALALEIAPDIAEKVQDVIVMGGVFYRPGNVTSHAEANIWNDPHAANKVLTANWPVTIHGLDITYQIAFDRDFLDKVALASKTTGSFLRDAADFYIRFYEEQHKFSGCCPHDLLAIVYATNPQWFICEEARFDVVTSGDEAGRTLNIIKDKTTGTSNKKIATKVDKQALLADYLSTIANLP